MLGKALRTALVRSVVSGYPRVGSRRAFCSLGLPEGWQMRQFVVFAGVFGVKGKVRGGRVCPRGVRAGGQVAHGKCLLTRSGTSSVSQAFAIVRLVFRSPADGAIHKPCPRANL